MVSNEKKTPRKSLPKTAIPRIYFIDEEIASGKYPSAPKLAKEYETSVPTIYRDIEFMKDMMNAPIEYDSLKKGYYYTDKTFRLAAAYATAEDILAVELVKELMEFYRNTPIHGQVYSLLESISLPVKDIQNTKWFKDRILIPKLLTVPVDPAVWQCIFTALKENRVIKFNYLSVDQKATNRIGNKQKTVKRQVTFHPYQLMLHNLAWSLYGCVEKTGRCTIINVSRMSDISLINKTFTLKGKLIKIDKERKSQFVIVDSKAKVYRFEIEYFGDIRWVQETVIGEDQKITKTKNGIKLSFSSNQLNKVISWVISRGPSVRPLKPKLLVDKWKETVKEMNRLTKI